MNDDEDFETLLELTAQLQLEDIQEWRSSLKGKNRVGVVSDVELSINSIEAHHKTTLQNIADRRFARSVHRAVTQDSSLIAALAAIEEQERSDRELALKLSINANANAQQPAPAVPTSLAHTILSRTKPTDNRSEVSSSSSVRSYPGSIFSTIDQASLSSRTSVSPAYKPLPDTSSFVPSILRLAGGRPSVDCIICGDSVAQAYHAPCGCFYDRDCLTDLFQKATVDESLFPPRCCNKQISFEDVRAIFSPQLIRAFEQKAEEYKTTNRLYCHNPRCSAFLGPAVGNERDKTNKQCTQCYRQTCTFCKGPGHTSRAPCPTDTEVQQVLNLGRQEGWQSCPSCHSMVELSMGCYHMTCRCRYQFCYLCAQQWKNCTCPQWDESRLMEQAQRRVVRNHGALPQLPTPAQFNAHFTQIQSVTQALRADHGCAHHTYGFIRLNGAGRCESCASRFHDSLLRCRGCAIQVCIRCRRNRL